MGIPLCTSFIWQGNCKHYKAKNFGIDWIEITPNHFLKSLYLVKQYSLCYSVGSDYHGQIFDKCNQLGINATFFEHDENYIKNKIRR